MANRFKAGDGVRLTHKSLAHGYDQGLSQYFNMGLVGTIKPASTRDDNHYVNFTVTALFNKSHPSYPVGVIITFSVYDDMLDPMWEDFVGGVCYRCYLGPNSWQRSFNPALLVEERAALAVEKPLCDLDLKVGAKGAMVRGRIKSTGEEFALLEI